MVIRPHLGTIWKRGAKGKRNPSVFLGLGVSSAGLLLTPALEDLSSALSTHGRS